MTASIELAGARVIAAMTPPTSKAPFNRGRPVLRASDGTIIRVRTYTSDDRAEGPTYSAEELQELIGAEQITDLTKAGPIPAASGASLWVLRRNLPRRDRALAELQMSGLLLHPALDGQDDAKLCVVAEGRPEGSAMLGRWRDEAMEAATIQAALGEWDRATTDAEVAQAVCRGLDPDVLGFLGLAYEKGGRSKRADGLLVMARRSRGKDFETQVIQAREHYRRILTSRRTAALAAALRRFFHPSQELGQPRSCRLVA